MKPTVCRRTNDITFRDTSNEDASRWGADQKLNNPLDALLRSGLGTVGSAIGASNLQSVFQQLFPSILGDNTKWSKILNNPLLWFLLARAGLRAEPVLYEILKKMWKFVTQRLYHACFYMTHTFEIEEWTRILGISVADAFDLQSGIYFIGWVPVFFNADTTVYRGQLVIPRMFADYVQKRIDVVVNQSMYRSMVDFPFKSKGQATRMSVVEQGMCVQKSVPERSLDTIFLDNSVKEELVREIEMFIKHPDTFRQMGHRLHLGYLLYGEPGSGKSALVEAIASHFRLQIVQVSLENGLQDLKRGLSKPPGVKYVCAEGQNFPYIVLLEDFDRYFDENGNPIQKRNQPQKRHQEEDVSDLDDEPVGQVSRLPRHHMFREVPEPSKEWNLSTLFQLLDGVGAGTGVIWFATANNTKVLNNTLVRPGRITRKYYFGLASISCIMGYTKKAFEMALHCPLSEHDCRECQILFEKWIADDKRYTMSTYTNIVARTIQNVLVFQDDTNSSIPQTLANTIQTFRQELAKWDMHKHTQIE